MDNSFAYNILRFFRFLTMLVLPGGVVILGVHLAIHYGVLTPWLPRIEQVFPYIILGIGMLLGWRFHRSRLAFVIFILFLSERSLYYFSTGGSYSFGYDRTILFVNCILLPMNMALFYLVRERGIFNLRGLTRVIFILLQPFLVFLLLRLRPDLFQYLSYQIIKHQVLDTLPFPQPIVAVYGFITFLFLVGSLLGRGGPIMRGFFWSLIAVMSGLIAYNNGGSAILFYSAAGLIIIISVIESAYAMAFQDELTGLPARRALNNSLHGLGRNYAIAMIDIDHFKKFNDRFGHDVGDQVLCMVASYLKHVGGGGKAFRYGGEEFTVLFPGKSGEDAMPHLERLRESIEAAQFVLRGKNRPKKPPRKIKKEEMKPRTVSVTVSIGVADSAKPRVKPSSVIKAADQALYRAKKRGRNCIAK